MTCANSNRAIDGAVAPLLARIANLEKRLAEAHGRLDAIGAHGSVISPSAIKFSEGKWSLQPEGVHLVLREPGPGDMRKAFIAGRYSDM